MFRGRHVQRAASAINYALSLHNLPALANLTLPKAVKSAARKTRRRPRRQAQVMERQEVAQILDKWGNAAEQWKRWVALLVGLSVCTLARWADAQFPVRGIILPDNDAAEICLPRRKNRQEGQTFWAAVPPSATVRLLRRMVRSLGFDFDPLTGAARAPRQAYLFPVLTHVKGSGRRGRAHWEVTPSTRPLNKKQYSVYLRLFRRALQDCCGMSPTESALFSLHSGRRTGDTLLRVGGKTQQERMSAGCWLDKDSEQLYNQFSLAERLKIYAATAI